MDNFRLTFRLSPFIIHSIAEKGRSTHCLRVQREGGWCEPYFAACGRSVWSSEGEGSSFRRVVPVTESGVGRGLAKCRFCGIQVVPR